MPKTSTQRSSRHRVVVASCAALLWSPLVANTQIDDPLEEIKVCARIGSTAKRVECYETLGQRALQAEAASVDPAGQSGMPPPGPAEAAETPVAAAQTVGKMTDDLGGPEFEKRAGKAMPTFAGVVTSCKKGAYGKYYFYFDNGQIWKQSGAERLRFRECRFNVTIAKDFGGYVMRIEGRKGRVRIARVD